VPRLAASESINFLKSYIPHVPNETIFNFLKRMNKVKKIEHHPIFIITDRLKCIFDIIRSGNESVAEEFGESKKITKE
jgi:hypothetical protein